MELDGAGGVVSRTTSQQVRRDLSRVRCARRARRRRRAERARLWQGRKKAFGAMGRVAPAPGGAGRRRAAHAPARVLRAIAAIGAATRRRGRATSSTPATATCIRTSATTRPTPTRARRVHAAMTEIMQACIAAGGTITGEHGVGLDKLRLHAALFDGRSLAAMCAAARRVRSGAPRESAARSCRCTPAANGIRPAARARGMTSDGRAPPATALRSRRTTCDRALQTTAAAAGACCRIAGARHLAGRGAPGAGRRGALSLRHRAASSTTCPATSRSPRCAGTTLAESSQATARARAVARARSGRRSRRARSARRSPRRPSGPLAPRLRHAARPRARPRLSSTGYGERGDAPADAW